MAGPGQPISEIFNEAAIEAQVKRILAQLGIVADSMLNVQKLAESTKSAQNMTNLSAAITAMTDATNTADKATLKLKNDTEELTVVISKAAAAKQNNTARMTEGEKMMKLYNDTIDKLNESFREEAQLVTNAKVAQAEHNKQMKEQAKQVLGLVGSYGQLEIQFKSLSTKAKDMAATWGVNSVQAKEAAVAANEVNNKLKAIDQSIGIYKRNVGNYASGFQNFNLIVREMPNFAISATTGLQSLSNNIPMFVDEVKKARDAGQSWGQVLKTLGVSLFSIGGLVTLLTVLITGLPKIMKELESGTDKVSRSFKTFQEVQKLAAESTVKEKVNLEALLVVAKDKNKTDGEREAAIKKINDIMPDYLGKITLESINTQEANDKIVGYINQLGRKALATAYITKLENLHVKQIESENSSISDNIKWYEYLIETIRGGGNAYALTNSLALKGMKNRVESVTKIKEEIKLLEDKFKSDLSTGKALLDLDKVSTEKKVASKKEVVDRTLEYQSKELKAIYEAEKAKIEASAATWKSIESDESLAFNVRLIAAKKYFDDQRKLIILQRQFEADELDIREQMLAKKSQAVNDPKSKLSADGKATELANIAAERKEINALRLKVDSEYRAKTTQAESKYYDTLDTMTKKHMEKQLADAKKLADERNKITDEAIKAGEDSVKDRELRSQELLYAELRRLDLKFIATKKKDYIQYEKDKEKIANEFAIRGIENQIEATKVALKISGLSAVQEQKYLTELAELKRRLLDVGIKYVQKTTEAEKTNLLNILQGINSAVQNVQNAISTLASIGFEQRQAQLDKEKEQIDINSAAELARIQASTLSAQDQAAEIIKLEARKQVQIEQNDQRRRKLDVERARFERLNSIAGIVTGTSLAVVNALQTKPAWLGIALAATVGALGLAQLTKAMTAPLPKYKHGIYGDKSHQGGLAVVGDGGKKEKVVLPSGESFDTPATPTIMDLPKGTQVYPDSNVINKAMMAGMVSYSGQRVREADNRELMVWQTQALLKGMANNKPIVRTKTNVSFGRDFYLFKQVFE